MFSDKSICTEWQIFERDFAGNLIRESFGRNLEVNSGRTRLISLAFCPTASAGLGGFYALGVGASATPAQVTDTRLTYELIGNSLRKTLTDTNGNVPQTGDVQTGTTVVGSCSYFQYIQLQAQYSTSDGNNGNTFNEYGLFDTTVLPGSPVSTSGTMFNHYIDPNPVNKGSGNSVTVIVTIRF